MEENSPVKKSDLDAESYIKLGNLLKKSRDAGAQNIIQDIMNSDMKMEEKIKKIEELDSSETFRKKEIIPIDDREVVEILKRKSITLPETVQKNTLSIKNPLLKSNFLLFLFREYGKIKEFAIQSQMVRPSIFKSHLNVRKSSIDTLQKDALQMLGYLGFVLESGWSFLIKHEYNLIVQFKRLCEEITETNLNYSGNEMNFLEKIKTIEQRFLACHYRPDYPDIIVMSVSAVMKFHQKTDDKVNAASVLTKRVLKQNGSTFSLYNMILALNMIIYRKYFSLQDLVQEKPGGVVSNFNFECPENIQGKINSYISENEKYLKELLAEKTEINKMNQFLKQFVQTSEDGNEIYNYGLLIAFYEGGSGNEYFNFNRDKENLAAFANNFVLRFFKEFESFLNGKVKVEKWGEVTLFTSDFFHTELGKIQTLGQKIAKQSYNLEHFTVDQYYEEKKNPSNKANREEAMVHQMIDELANDIVDLGKKAGHLSVTHLTPQPDEEKTAEFRTMDPSLLIRNSFSVPIWSNYILNPGFFQKKTLGQAVSTLASLCFLVGHFLMSSKILSINEKNFINSDEIQKVKHNLERIADVVAYEKIRRKYNL